MKLFPVFVFIFLSAGLFAQGALELQGEPVKILSSEDEALIGRLTNPQISPSTTHIFAFTRAVDGNQFLYIYDIPAKQLLEVAAEQNTANLRVDLPVYNDHLDWRPKLDKQGRQWFAFVSSGTERNKDLYISYIGSNSYLRLTSDKAIDQLPKWSPDGNSIAFLSSRTGSSDIYLMENVEQVMKDLSLKKARVVQLTDTPQEETGLAWNPDLNAFLLAFSRRQEFLGREAPTFQIRVMDLKKSERNVLRVTNDPLQHYTQPQWDPHAANRLLYVGESITLDPTANLYLSELTWNEEKTLQNKSLEGYKTEVFQNVELSGTAAVWLSGGKAILCQEDRPEQNNPLYSVNIDRWLQKIEGARNYFEQLHASFPFITSFHARENILIFISQEGEFSNIYSAQIFGTDIDPNRATAYALKNPQGGGGINAKYILAGGAAVAGVAGIIILINGGGEGGQAQLAPIGLPPSAPK